MVMGMPSLVVMFKRSMLLVCWWRGGLRSREVKEEENYDDREHGPLESNLNYPQRLHETSPLCLLLSAMSCYMESEGLQ